MQLVNFDNNISRGILKEAHISDIHFGAMDPKIQYEILREQFISKLIDLPLDLVSIDGDLFDHKSMTNSDITMYTIKFIDELIQYVIRPKNITLFIIAGTKNHDNDQLKIFYHYMSDPTIDIRIVETIKFEYVKNAKILCIPELAGIDESIYRTHLFESGLYDEVFMHGTIKGAVYGDNPGTNCRLFTMDDFINCLGPIISGHIHNGGCYDKYFYYCGSPYSWSFADDYRKGFFIVLHNLDTGMHYVHKEIIESFRYETINLDDMVMLDSKVIIDAIDELKRKNSIDYIRVEFNLEVPKDTQYMIDTYFSNNGSVKFNYKFTKEQKYAQNKVEQDEKLSKYKYIFDPSLSEYDKLSKYINDNMGYVYISADEIKRLVEEVF